jgi:hypothetical protein
MAGIGMRFAASGAVNPNIEYTIFFASEAGMDRDDLRTLALLVTWFGVHSAWVNASRLTRLVNTRGSMRVQAFWSALAGWQSKDRRFARLRVLPTRERISVPSSASAFLMRRHGEDPRFKGSPIRVAANVLRDRPEDVLLPAELARIHRAYRDRVQNLSGKASRWPRGQNI